MLLKTFCCYKQQALEIRFKFHLRANYEYLRNIKPYGLFINAEIFLKGILIKLQNLQFLQVNNHSVGCWLGIFTWNVKEYIQPTVPQTDR